MSALAHRAAILVVCAATFTMIAAQVNNSPWPPGVQKVSESSPPLPPDQAMKTFYMPPGYRLELVASEPLVQDPIVMDFDADGRIWIVEMPTWQPEDDLTAASERDPACRIVVLEDTNDDGKADKRTVFMDRLVLPRAIKVLDRGVLIGEPPNLWLARDTNGDLKADTKDLVTNTYGRADGNIEHNANSLLWAMDNWIYTSEHDGYLRLKNGKFETAKTLARGQWGASQDDVGRVYRDTNSAALFVDIIPARYFMRNPTLPRTRGLYESLQNDAVNTVFPVRPTLGVNRGYQTGILRADGTLRAVHRGRRSNDLSRRPAACRAVWERVPCRVRRQSRRTADRQRRRHDAAGAQSARPCRISRVDRRALPSGVALVRSRRHVVRARHVSRHHSASRLHHRVPSGLDSSRTTCRKASGSAASTGWSTRRRAATHDRPCPAPRRRSCWRRSRIRTAGAATWRNSFWFSVPTDRLCRR